MRSKRYLISEMDQNVKQMLKLIEEDGDSFAKKAEMYYKKRPELINLVDEFYRMYRSLAERYEHVSSSRGSSSSSASSCVSEICSEPPSTCPSPDRRSLITRRRSGPPRAPGFDFFNVAISNHSESFIKDGYESSTLDSEYESDDSSVINYMPAARYDEDHGLRRRVAELELEIRDVHEKYRLLQEETFLEMSSTADVCGGDLQICSEDDPDSQIRCLEEKNKHIEDLNSSHDEFKLKYETLLAEKNELDARITTYVAELEENREAIRQLCISLEHYRNGYNMLRKSVIGHNHPAD